MEFKNLENDVNEGLSQREIAEKHQKSQATIRFWLSKYKLKTIPRKPKEFCKSCGRIWKKSICNSCWTTLRRLRAKKKAVELLGGKCTQCGWAGHLAAFEFHHIDSERKDFSIGNIANKSWDVVSEELRKCILLCSNCHRIEHSLRYENEELLSRL